MRPRLYLILYPSLFVLLNLTLPRSALAAYSTYLNVQANDSATHRTSEDYSQTIEDQIYATAQVGYDGRTSYYGSQYPVEASSTACFDLTTGETKFYVESVGYEASAAAGIALEDTIYPSWKKGYSGTMNIQINWSFVGEKRAYSLIDGQWQQTSYWTPKNWILYALFSYRVDDGAFQYSPYDQYNLADGLETWSRTISFDPSANTSITVKENMTASLDSYNSQKLIADFSNTGLIEIILPEGASYTSDSGVFLTIPEPASLLLLAIATSVLRISNINSK